MRRATALAAAVVALLLLAGCVDIPTSGGVSKQTIDNSGGDAPVPTLPDEPVKGASQDEILAGFIRAGRGSQNNYQVARDFLTPDFRVKWNPNAGVLISPSTTISTSGSDNERQIVVTATAEVDAHGHYTTYATPQSKPLLFQFQKDKNGQWRISSAPDGTILTPNRFSSIFHSYDLFFFDPSLQYLVPDRRWFADSTQVASRIVRELLTGPSDYLTGGVVVSAFPSNTELTTAPTIDSGRATVDLSSQVSSQSATAKQRMTQQLAQSLSGLVASVSITVGGFPVTVADGPEPDRYLSVLKDPVGFEKGVFGTLVSGSAHPLPGIGTAIDKLSPSGAAVGRNGDEVAALSAAGVSIVRGTAAAVLLDTRKGLAVPSMDPEGFVWSVPADEPGAIIAYDASNKPHPVPLTLDGTVVSMAVSRDGTRLLMAVQSSSGPKLLVAGIVRDKNLVPTGFGQPYYLTVGSQPLLSASWVDNESVVVLTTNGDTSAVTKYDLGGQSSALGTVDGGMAVVGGNSDAGIRVLAAGSVFALSGGFGWQDTGLNASFLASQQ